ncbi:hypothetical protein GCM10010359_26040 [Streptomyces morookaense]|nr:hypothetical protein GCM10010359_26040 [Streptomyces morookaense]
MAVLATAAAGPPPGPSEEPTPRSAYVRIDRDCLIADDTSTTVSYCRETPAAPTPPAKPAPRLSPRPAPPPPSAPAPAPTEPPPPPPVARAAPRAAEPPPPDEPAPPPSPRPPAQPARHVAAYRPSVAAPPAQGGASPVTLMLVLTAPAVLAAAALRPRPGGRGR